MANLNYSLGVCLYQINKQKVNRILIKKGTELPVCHTEKFLLNQKGQKEIQLSVIRSDSEEIYPKKAEVIHEIKMGLEKELSLRDVVEFTLQVDISGKMDFKIHIPALEKKKGFDMPIVADLIKLEKVEEKLEKLEKTERTESSKRQIKLGVKQKREIPLTIQEYFSEVYGMQAVKEKIAKCYALLQMREKWMSMGLESDTSNWNFIISGEGGSGKSLLVEILCDMMYQFQLVSSPEPVVLRAKNLIEDISVLRNQGSSKVILIEEVESICPSNCEEQGGNSVDVSDVWSQIKDFMEEESQKGKERNYFIFSGGRDEIKRLLVDEPKLENMASVLEIASYDLDELFHIAKKMIKEKGFFLTRAAEERLKSEIKYEATSKNFANAITLERIVRNAIENKSERELNTGMVGRKLEPSDFRFDEPAEDSLEEVLDELEAMIGLDAVKREVQRTIHRVQDRQRRMECGECIEEDKFFLHTMLLGAPGTGKTTVARLLGRIYGALGLLRKGDLFVEVTRSDFVGQYQGTTAIKTHELIESAVGGVLFLDEAYSLFNGNGDNFGQEAVTEFLKYAWDYRDRMMIILAGYEDEMEQLMNANSGMARRFPNKIYFEDYSKDQLYDIFKMKVKNRYCIAPEAEEPLKQMIGRYSKLKGYENGGGIDIHIQNLAGVIADRNMTGDAETGEYRNTIIKEDVEETMRHGKHGMRPLGELLDELDNMVGLTAVKKAVREAVDNQRYQKKLMEKFGKSADIDSEHMIFAGPPGTGKSTLAELITQIYCAVGIVQDPTRCVTVTKSDLNSEFMGGALEKAKQIIEKARGGVLFIDEAYALVEDEKDFYGKQVLTELMYSIEKYRGEIVLIMAGYKEQIDELIRNYNPGMASRISTVIPFEDYTVDELVEIFYRMTKKGDVTYRIEEGSQEIVKKLIETRIAKFEAEGKDFGNARGVRNLMSETIKQVIKRCVDRNEEDFEDMTLIRKTDLEALI